ncbi:DUF3012 domain-containing protein [Vibrio sp.]|nr:DUF3012 domain-containing protein [Vibrio sp.]
MKKVMAVLLSSLFLAACAPEVGSKDWCKEMDKKPKGDWTASETGDYTKHCIL